MMNQLQALAMNEGQRRKKKLWNEQGRAQSLLLMLIGLLAVSLSVETGSSSPCAIPCYVSSRTNRATKI